VVRAAILLCLPLLAEDHPCAACHPREVEAYARSPMARSLHTVADQPDGRLRHSPSDSKIEIRHDADGVMIHRLTSRGLTAEYPIAYAIGAGKVGFSYLIAIPPFLFQSPASYYSQAGVWDVTPGYEPERVLDFTHPITEGCVFCHSNTVNLIPGTDNQFRQPALSPISCERCHGLSQAHLEKPVPGSIVNPAKLPSVARDSVCEQCHLEGEMRILNPGKHWQDFQAGNTLETVFSTYLVRTAPGFGDKAVSQSEQLSLSRCARESSGRLWCGTCHDPHSSAANRAEEVRAACLTCHEPLFAAQKHKPATECVSCHMPRIRPSNIAHAAITSHRLALPSAKPASPPKSGELTAWREPGPALAARNLGLALFQTGGRDEVYRSYQILAHLPQRDPAVLAALGSILLQQNHADLAVALYKLATAAEPRNARFAYILGVALNTNGDRQSAIAELRHSIELDPSAPDAYRKLSEIYDQLRMYTQSKQALADYLKFMPQSISLRRN
jgi:Doubled CXXCH motif (Paired_CXXCH_1)/Cytochrome c554 and c-prime/Tetratricopeptide repeat